MPCKENIRFADVNRELTRLWESAPSPNKIKASLFNLIVYSQKSCRTSYLQDFVKSVVEAFPCRILFIEGNEMAPPKTLRTCVASEITSKGDITIHCDKITIEASKDRLSRIPYLLLPHLIEDLPIFLLWGQDPTGDDAVLPHLEKFADRVIFDSEAVDNLPLFANKLLDKSSAQVVDMNWARLSGWRHILSNSFNTQEDIEQIKEAKTIDITFNSRITSCFFHNEFQAMYLQGWLAAQLGFLNPQVQKEGYSTRVTYQNSYETPTLITTSAKEHATLPPGSILKVEIHTHAGNHYTLNCSNASQVLVEATTPKQCQVPYTLPLFPIEEGTHFMKELFYEPVNNHYNNMLQALTSLK